MLTSCAKSSGVSSPVEVGGFEVDNEGRLFRPPRRHAMGVDAGDLGACATLYAVAGAIAVP